MATNREEHRGMSTLHGRVDSHLAFILCCPLLYVSVCMMTVTMCVSPFLLCVNIIVYAAEFVVTNVLMFVMDILNLLWLVKHRKDT